MIQIHVLAKLKTEKLENGGEKGTVLHTRLNTRQTKKKFEKEMLKKDIITNRFRNAFLLILFQARRCLSSLNYQHILISYV
jgi:hypothetical protein